MKTDWLISIKTGEKERALTGWPAAVLILAICGGVGLLLGELTVRLVGLR
jgi:hypothetical protein